jgi:hypothetical protein
MLTILVDHLLVYLLDINWMSYKNIYIKIVNYDISKSLLVGFIEATGSLYIK